MNEEFKKVDYESHRCAVCYVTRSIRENREPVFLEYTSDDRLHRSFIVGYKLDLPHFVSAVADQVPYVCSGAFRFIIRVRGAHYRQILRHEVSILRFFLPAEYVFPERSFHAPYSLTLM